MSIRCKVCNATKNPAQENSDLNWECKVCGSLLDSKGRISSA